MSAFLSKTVDKSCCKCLHNTLFRVRQTLRRRSTCVLRCNASVVRACHSDRAIFLFHTINVPACPIHNRSLVRSAVTQVTVASATVLATLRVTAVSATALATCRVTVATYHCRRMTAMQCRAMTGNALPGNAEPTELVANQRNPGQ